MDDVRDDPITGARLWAGMTVDELVGEYARCGINARSIAETTDIVETMVADDDCTVIMSVAGPMVPGGLRGMFEAVIESGWVDAIVTTGATLTHDAIETLGGHHHHGEAPTHDGTDSRREHDERLRDASVDRIYNVYLPQEHFATFETHLWDRVFPELTGEACTIAELTRTLGHANDELAEGAGGLTAAAARNDIPVFCPAVQDSILGLQAWLYSRTHDFSLDALGDMTDLTELASSDERAGALIIAGGVPKNFTLQTKLVTPGAYDYAVQFTMDPEATGGLSGASLDEARSWGKLDPDAANATVLGDATLTVPLVFAAVYDRLS